MTEAKVKAAPKGPDNPAPAQKAEDLPPGVKGSKWHRVISEEELNGYSKSEIKAVAADRGYDIGEGGRRSLTGNFLDCQEGDGFAKEGVPKDETPAMELKRKELEENVKAAEAALDAHEEAVSRAVARADLPAAEPGIDDPKGVKAVQNGPLIPQASTQVSTAERS